MKVLICNNSEVEISGTTAELNALAQAMQYDEAEIPCELALDPQPYTRFLRRIVIRHAAGQKLRFASSYDALEIVGDPVNLEFLSKEMSDFPDLLPPGYHVHVECLGGKHYISLDSLPIVIAHLNN